MDCALVKRLRVFFSDISGSWKWSRDVTFRILHCSKCPNQGACFVSVAPPDNLNDTMDALCSECFANWIKKVGVRVTLSSDVPLAQWVLNSPCAKKCFDSFLPNSCVHPANLLALVSFVTVGWERGMANCLHHRCLSQLLHHVCVSAEPELRFVSVLVNQLHSLAYIY